VRVRELIKGRQSAAVALALVMIVGAAIAIYVQARDPASGPGGAYFSTDDGKTFFADSATKLPPFDKDGKPAYRAHVFECGGKRVVGYLSRYRPEAIAALEEAAAARGTGKPPRNAAALASVGTWGLELKRPGDPVWISQADPRTATMIRVYRCPDGSTPSEVEP
jgi:hypothetical protein